MLFRNKFEVKIYYRLNSIIIFVYFTYCSGFPADEITALPGLKQKPAFRQYSGYLDIGNGRHLFYWLVESQTKPETSPVILWLNGCSSMTGLWAENGPFTVSTDGKTLVQNKNSWNTLANVLYLESPAGSGYSYTTNSTDQHNNDDKTAEESYLGLQKFFEKFPQFSNNSFYLTGESYAGIYIPMLALKISTNKSKINLKGVSIGNGLLDKRIIFTSRVKFAYTHGIIDSDDWKSLAHKSCLCKNNEQECQFSEMEIGRQILANDVHVHNIYSDCKPFVFYSSDSLYYQTLQSFGTDLEDIRNNGQNLYSSTKCVTDSFISYFNSVEVRKAAHIPQPLPQWTQCRGLNYTQQYSSMKSEVKELM